MTSHPGYTAGMRAITLLRALAWVGTAVVLGSLILVRWGENPNLPPGPPGQWEKLVVGACLLAVIAALAISVSGRKRNPPTWTARGVAAATAAMVLVIAFELRSEALATGFAPDLLGGQGWTWLVLGGSVALGAALGTMALKPPRPPRKPRRRR